MPLRDKKPFFTNQHITIDIGKGEETFTVEAENSFHILFFLSPSIILEANDVNGQVDIAKNTYVLHYSSQKRNAQLFSHDQFRLNFLHIRMDYSFITELINPEESIENSRILDKMIKNQFILHNATQPPKITVEMHMIIKEITGSSKKGVFQKLLIEAKVIKLLMLIFEQFSENKTVSSTKNTAQITKSFIDKYYTQQISTHDIATKFGFNETKIRSEFKSEFKTTVSEYINELRMLKAKKMIITKKHLIKEIASECGYEYVPNFSRAFKKKFGISPDKLRNI